MRGVMCAPCIDHDLLEFDTALKLDTQEPGLHPLEVFARMLVENHAP